MVCKKCGKENSNEAKFCVSCGAQLGEEESSNNSSNKQVNNNKLFDLIMKLPKKQKMILGGGFVGVVAILIVIIVILNSPKSMSLLEDNSVNFEGYNGTAYAYLNINPYADGLDTEIESMYYKLEASKGESKYAKNKAKYQAMLDLVDSVACEMSEPNSNLSNGDKVTVSCKYSEAASKASKLKYKDTTKEYIVSGLPEPTEIKLFDDLSFEWEYDSWSKATYATIRNNNTDFDLSTIVYHGYWDLTKDATFVVYCYEDIHSMNDNGYKVIDENVRINEDGYYEKDFEFATRGGRISELASDESINIKVEQILDKQVEVFVDNIDHTITNNEYDVKSAISGYELVNFEDDYAYYSIHTDDGDYKLKFYTQIIQFPTGEIFSSYDENYVKDNYDGIQSSWSDYLY